MPEAVIAAIALGANLADRRLSINLALAGIARLPATTLLRVSNYVETEPVGVVDQPSFLNACALIETALEPRDLLEALLTIERALGRDRARERRWGPRTIDLDLLLMGDRVVDGAELTIPHPRMHERLFVLEPLARIAPGLLHPVLGTTVAEILEELLARTSAEPRRGDAALGVEA